jgi:hypothetical protein
MAVYLNWEKKFLVLFDFLVFGLSAGAQIELASAKLEGFILGHEKTRFFRGACKKKEIVSLFIENLKKQWLLQYATKSKV